MIIQADIDELVRIYETEDFIKNDPVQFAHRYKNSKKDCEIAGFLASLLAYGNRKVFVKKLEELFFKIAQDEPLNFVLNCEAGDLRGFNYRFGKEGDFEEIFRILKKLYLEGGSLEALFGLGYDCGKIFEIPVDYFYGLVDEKKVGQGFYHMIPNPRNSGAMKRMCMFLRWMIRDGAVDLGLWDFMKASDLYIPLDVHVARVSREMGLLTRKSNDFRAVVELTQNLKKFDANDPVKYDFAMFGYGIDKNN